MVDEKLLKKHKLLFGESAPIPPDHIMETLVEMKEDGSFKEKIEKIREHYPDIKKKYKDETGRDLTPDDPLFDIDFRKLNK
tara:strand:+ start:100 stop:342 length:243 start_codon:yes stop_codon:yes gene_type:complete